MNELQTFQAADAAPAPAFNVTAVMMDPARLTSVMEFAKMMAGGAVTVPQHLRGKPSDCFAITLQALRWGMDPYIVGGKTHLVNGNLGYEAQLVVAVLKNSGAVRGRPHYEFRGEGNTLECRAGFIPAGEDAIVWTEWLSISGITTKNSPLWKVNPRQQFGYLQARNWARLYAPDALLGVYTSDELEVLPAQPGGQRDLPRVDEVQPAQSQAQPAGLPTWPADAFSAQLPRWTKAIQVGLKSHDDIVALAKSKGELTVAQLDSIRGIQMPPKTEPAQATDPETDSFAAEYDAAEEGAK